MTSTTTGLWKQHSGNPVENYERYFVPTIGTAWAGALLEAADLRAGERVLDIACGTGVVTRRAAERVGPRGSVTGLDISAGMLEIARAGSAEIDWREGDAAALPLPDGAFDVVVSSLGMQFVEDKQSALREVHRVLTPGGRVAIATVGPTPPLFAVLEQALARHVSPEVAGFMRAVFSLYDPEQLRTLATDAGFDDIDVRSKALTVTLPAPAEFLWQYVHSTPLIAAIATLDDAKSAALQQDVVAGWQSFVRSGELVLTANAVLTTAKRRKG
ncbi:methyltransferase domain-containing protein [Saccharothrix variisporea]|uniref:Ubiquinone/menaquinone biosynthesis C-methylase UbiE n=1 Tax=Saccharothrix variisporea TaxID=543527 RepID=A0A495XIW7_9PSEU|nr:methyltransferase domain-containing protein [Saccharothrix variisporea]RKT74017.1 ubiquinone/menaquinone biosynthesis C-methylase UbiE [Saccharothrix variisporea]